MAIGSSEQKGNDALSAGLWEVAELHFKASLKDPSLSPEARSQAAVHLAESLIRSGNPDEALELLALSYVAKNPEASFWKAHALAGKNRFKEAADLFANSLADPAAPYRIEAGLTQASLLLVLGQADAALDVLTALMKGADSAKLVEIQLDQVEILLDLGRSADARNAMPKPESIADSDRALAGFLEAQLLLEEGKNKEAEAAFQTLINQPEGQSLSRYHLAALGLADAIHAQEKSEIATRSLLTFLQDHQESPALEAIFKRLLEWLPEKLTATDPVLDQLTKWITPPISSPADVIFNSVSATGSESVSAWPTYRKEGATKDLSIYSLYARSIGLHRIGTQESKAEAKQLLRHLLMENPDHILADRSLYQLARWALDAGANEQAFSILDVLRETTDSGTLKGEAAFLEARAAYLDGNSESAIKLFDEAAIALSGPEAKIAKRQAAITRIRSGELKGVSLIQQSGTPADPELEADLALERALSANPPSQAKTEIEEFLKRFPDHPRAPEARLAAVEISLSSQTADVEFIRTQLEILAVDVEKFPENLGPRVALAKLRLTDRSKDFVATIAVAQQVMDTYPADPAASEAALTLGRNLFQSGSYHPARLVLEKLAASGIEPIHAQPAWLLAARSAALGATPKSKEEALILFDKAIESGGPLRSIATLEKGANLIDMYRLPEASAFLATWIKSLPENDPLQLPAGLLLGEALYAQGSSNPASLIEALAVYDRLLIHAKSDPALFNRLQHLRGTTLEQLPDEKDPQKKREKQAFQAFHSVLETTTAPAEWEYFERCGFRALALLEKAERWPVAITVAKKIASFKGPRAEEAATRASELQLKHMIWED